MIVMTAVVVGGAICAGISAYQKYRRRRIPVWVIENGRQAAGHAIVVEPDEALQIERRVVFNLNLATFSLGLTIAGVVLYTPLIIVALPFNIFDVVIMFEDCWLLMLEQNQTWLGVGASTLIVAATLIAHMHLLASLLEWLYFLGQKAVLTVERFAAIYGSTSSQQPETIFA